MKATVLSAAELQLLEMQDEGLYDKVKVGKSLPRTGFMLSSSQLAGHQIPIFLG